MTDEERKDARQLAERNAKRAAAEYGDSYYVVALDNTLKGYAAACEAKRAEITGLKAIADNKMRRSILRRCLDALKDSLQNERARSAKLISVLKSAYLSSDPTRSYTDVSQAIAEYEAGRE